MHQRSDFIKTALVSYWYFWCYVSKRAGSCHEGHVLKLSEDQIKTCILLLKSWKSETVWHYRPKKEEEKKAVLWQLDLAGCCYQTVMMSFPQRRSWQPWGRSKQTDNTLYDTDWGFSHCHHKCVTTLSWSEQQLSWSSKFWSSFLY